VPPSDYEHTHRRLLIDRDLKAVTQEGARLKAFTSAVWLRVGGRASQMNERLVSGGGSAGPSDRLWVTAAEELGCRRRPCEAVQRKGREWLFVSKPASLPDHDKNT